MRSLAKADVVLDPHMGNLLRQSGRQIKWASRFVFARRGKHPQTLKCTAVCGTSLEARGILLP